MSTSRGRVRAVIGWFCVGALTAQCSPRAASPASPPAVVGMMKPVVSVKELMKYVIDPLSDNIFEAVGTIATTKETVEIFPKTDADWEKVKVGAVTLAEGIYLLKVRRPFAPPGDLNESTGPNAPELAPAQIQAKVDADPVLWDAKIEQLRNVALEVLEIVKKKDVNDLFAAGEDLDKACESCHLEYWYPGDRKLLEEAEKRRSGAGR